MFLHSSILVIGMMIGLAQCVEQGRFTYELTNGKKGIFPKTLYKDTKIKFTVERPKCTPEGTPLTIKWLVRSSSCYAEYATITSDVNRADRYFDEPFLQYPNGGSGYYITNVPIGETMYCGQATVLDNSTSHGWIKYPPHKENVTQATVGQRKKRAEEGGSTPDVSTHEATDDNASAEKETEGEKSGGKSAASDKTEEKSKAEAPAGNSDEAEKSENAKSHRTDNNVMAIVQYEAPYVVIVSVEGKVNFSCQITVDMISPKGYLSAHEYPLLTFYLIMCIVYSFYALAWLVMSACNFRDLLRVQFWIGGVILLGMIEKAVFYSEYLSIDSTGESVLGAEKFAEVVSALKRSLARMLVIIVSLGFGIVKPRLGPMLHRVIGIGMLYFILAVVEALVRTDTAMKDPSSNNLLFASIPLAVLDSVICWWIFVSLMQTMKTLRLRRNVVKLSLYRHFANTIIFCVLASFIMIIWSVHSRDQCMSEWRELWVDHAFWHILFSVILLVIMILWRPNINNQRYAFSPLIDAEDEEVEEPMLGAGATETIKMRGLKNAADPAYNPASKAEDDLKWIEENIPQTVADAALPAILDSDEEVMTTKYEMNKME